MEGSSGGPKRTGFFSGLQDGVAGFFKTRMSPHFPNIVPQPEVSDAFTVAKEVGPLRAHEMAVDNLNEHPFSRHEAVRQHVRDAHQYGYGYAAGTIATGLATSFTLRSMARMNPRFSVPLMAAAWTSTAVGFGHAFSMPNEINRRIKAAAPEMHSMAADAIHTKAEEIRGRK